jgi:hypothetical protein
MPSQTLALTTPPLLQQKHLAEAIQMPMGGEVIEWRGAELLVYANKQK